ncbi:hypothetical protein TRFO_30021 [Tritrichomonas foetus]|uniref:non-specific serine/threonine protein kinase n=1 Tax=Tritrichomonas foetus TaxID=1144522 RepID=A0A1J4JZ44_9EUKA|nr:hypothetical protein TRFO_30021 [Tritrichomonas foetus]|eukprot:OHT02766.1 hypothetical protein TRFO_30021 [Tritrichomonas foetus]
MQAKSRRLSTFGSMPEVPSEYKSIYAYFVVQYHQLEDYLKSIIRLHSQKPENKCISLMESHLKSILSSQYGSLLVVCKNAILDLNNILSNEKDAAINSLAQDILFVCLSIFQLSPSPTSRGVNIEFNHVRKPSQNNTHNTQSGTQNNHNASSHNLNHIQYASSNPSLSQGEIAKHFPQILQQKHGRKINPNRSLNLNQDFGPNVHHHQNVISIGSNNQKSSFAPKAMIESKSKHSPINTSTSFDSYMATNNEANVSPSSYPKISSEFNMSPNHSYNSNLDSVGNHSYSSNGELLMSDSQLDHSDGQLDHRDSQLNDSLTSHGSTKIMNGNSFPSLASPQSLPPRANPSGYSRRKSTGSIIRLESLRSRSSSLLLETKFPDSELTDNSDNDKNYVLCRICDEKVPLDLIEEHTDSCLNAYQNASIGTNVDIQLKKCISDCQTEHMNVKWPGQQRIATMTLIPMLKLIVLMNQAIQIDLNFSDSQEVLSQIISEINVLKADNNNPTVTSILKEIRPLLKQKLRASKAILNAEVILSQTRKSGDGHKKFQTQAQISDFDFVKRISRGAYARVFLARKKNSGDIFAIKVIPKSSLQNKNQVKRVLDEKNILLQFSNPYIVNFCMYFLFLSKAHISFD